MVCKWTQKKIFAGIFFFSCFTINAQTSLGKYLPAEVCSELMINGCVQRMEFEKDSKMTLLPDCVYAEKCREVKPLDNEGEGFLSEQVYVIKKSELNTLQKSPAQLNIEDVAEIFTSVSKMAGMKYYSTTRKKKLTLYKQVNYVPSAKDKTVLPDLNITNSDGLEKYIMLDDSSFGENVYKMDYSQSEDCLCAILRIEDSMGIGPVKAIKGGNLIVYYLVVDSDDSYVIYLAVNGTYKKMPGMKKQISDSLNSRLEAVYDWFITQF